MLKSAEEDERDPAVMDLHQLIHACRTYLDENLIGY
jgi:hypothetical protein